MRWLGRPSRAGGARRGADALLIEQDKNRLALDVFEAQVEGIRQAFFAMSIDAAVRTRLEERLFQPVAQLRYARLVGIHAVQRELRRFCHADNAGDVFGPAAAAAFL